MTPTNQKLLAGSGAALVLGSVLPWAKVDTIFGSISKNGTDGDGMVTLLAGAGIAALAFWTVGARLVLATIAAAVSGLVAVVDVIDVLGTEDVEFAQVSVGIGLWLCLGASIVGVVACIRQFREPAASPVAEADAVAVPPAEAGVSDGWS